MTSYNTKRSYFKKSHSFTAGSAGSGSYESPASRSSPLRQHTSSAYSTYTTDMYNMTPSTGSLSARSPVSRSSTARSPAFLRQASYSGSPSSSSRSSLYVTSAPTSPAAALWSTCDAPPLARSHDVMRGSVAYRTDANVLSAAAQRKYNSFRPTGTSKFYSSQYPSRSVVASRHCDVTACAVSLFV